MVARVFISLPKGLVSGYMNRIGLLQCLRLNMGMAVRPIKKGKTITAWTKEDIVTIPSPEPTTT